jgi:hypothetical protein
MKKQQQKQRAFRYAILNFSHQHRRVPEAIQYDLTFWIYQYLALNGAKYLLKDNRLK